MSDLNTASPYCSFLICRHPGLGVTNLYLNGQPLGVIRNGTFAVHHLGMHPIIPRPITPRDLAQPFPFASIAEMRAAFHAAIDAIVIEEPAAPVNPLPPAATP